GKGWVRFEPTPGFNREISGSTSIKKTDRPEQAPKGPDVFVTPEEQQTAVKGKAKINLTLIFVPLLGMIVFLLLFTVIVRALSKAGFDKLSAKEKLNRLSKEILSCLVSLGHVRNDNETLREFAERAREDLGEHSEDFVRITERLVYSDLKEEPSDYELMSACHREVLSRLKQRNRLRYVIKTVFSRFW
ncbi:MAG: hypothetical protein ILP13_09975, partial [Lachnospiraceae bacterium]|nr:hypothetical protein [Lachnospiraceae bacterium]